MPTEIEINLSQKAQEILGAPGGVPRKVIASIQAAMNLQMELTASAVVKNRMSELRKGPISPDKLRVETGRLRRSMMRGGDGNISKKAEFTGNEIVGSVGTNVRYAAVHEFGGTFRRTLRATSRAVERNFFGKKRTVVRIGFRQAHSATYPARRPIGRTVDERRQIFVDAISKAIVEASKS
jgi:phage gpG-like protein